MNVQRECWLETLFSTQPADRESAESGVRAFFDAAGLDAPRHIVWLDSPAEACYGALLLCAAKDFFLGRLSAGLEKMPGPRAEMARIREKLQHALGVAEWDEATAAVGPPLAGTGAPPRHDVQFQDHTGAHRAMEGPFCCDGKSQ